MFQKGKTINKLTALLLTLVMLLPLLPSFSLTAYAANNLTIVILDELENEDDYEWCYQLYDGDVSIAEGTYVQINIGTWHTDVMKIYMNGEVVYTKPSGSLYKDDVYHFTAGKNCKILGGDQNMFDWYTNPNVRITMDPAHTHSFSYTADGATITASCGEGCDVTTGLTLSISAPTGDLVADGTKTFPATLSTGYNTTAFPGTYNIAYTKDGQPYNGTPTEAGAYVASVTVGDATASVNYTVISALAAAKTAAKGELDTLLAGKNEADYDADDWTALTQAITDGKTAIDNATTTDAVATAKSNAETAVNAIKTTAEKAAEALATAKTTAKGELDTLLAGKNEADYDANDWTALTQAIADGKTAIDNATTTDAVATAKSNAETAVNAIKTKAEKKDAADTAAANGASDTINALPAANAVTTADKDAIEAARAAYNALTADQKAKVSAETLQKLTDAETALAAAQKDAADTAAANGASDTINALPAANAVTTADKDAIEAARAAYNALTADQKAKVSAETLQKLADAETALTAAQKDAADTAAANGASDTINALPAANAVTTADKDAIEAARAAYNALTADQKAKVSAETLQKLTDAETALTAAEKAAADQAVADAVVDSFNALPTQVTVDDKDTIEAARAAYDALTDDQKALIDEDTYKKLTDAETALAAAQKDAADTAAANGASDTINALPAAANVTVADKATIEAARAAYDALTADQKAKVSAETLQKLTDAETALAKAQDSSTTSPQTGDNSHIGLWIAIMLLSLCALSATLFIGKKKRVFDR